MSTINPKAAFSTGDVMKRLTDHDDDIRSVQTARRLPAASIGSGGLRVFGGGSIRMTDGGDIIIEGGGQLRVVREDGPGIVVEGGGSVDVNDGGTIRARYEDGATGIFFGTLSLQGTEEPSGHGLLVQDDNAGSNRDIFRAQREVNGDKNVLIGSITAGVPAPVDLFDVQCERIQIDAIGTAGTMTVDAENAIFLDGELGVVLEPLNGGLFFTTPATTSDPANLNISTTGLIQEVTSSRRFKVDIEDYHVDPGTVLDLKPRTWRDRAEVERDTATDRWHIGFIAEEVDELGLTGFVEYDQEERPKSIAYDRLTVALLEVVKDQDRRLAAIEARLSRLDKQPVPIDAAVQTTVKPKRKPSLTTSIEQPSREVHDARP